MQVLHKLRQCMNTRDVLTFKNVKQVFHNLTKFTTFSLCFPFKKEKQSCTLGSERKYHCNKKKLA